MVQMGGNEAISRVRLSLPHALLPYCDTSKRIFAKLPWVQQLKPCIKLRCISELCYLVQLSPEHRERRMLFLARKGL